MITASLYVDLRHECTVVDHDDGRQDRRQLMELDRCPDGARVLVDLGSRSWLYDDVICLLRKHGDRLSIELRGSHPEGVAKLVLAARGNTSEAVA